MTQRNWSWEAKQLLLHLAGMLGNGVTVQVGGGGLVAHALNSGTWHTGTLAEAQAPWAITQTVYDAHVANANAHHARQHALDDGFAHIGLLPWLWLDKTGASLADLPTRLYADLQSRAHSIVGGDNTISGGDWDVVMNVGTGTPGVRTALIDVSGGETALLRSYAGGVTVNSITAAGTDARVRTPLVDTLSGDLVLSPQSGWVTVSSLSAAGRLRSPLLDTATGNMAISPAVDVVLSPVADIVLNPGGWVELTNGKTLRTESFASGFVGNGFRIDQGVSVAGQTTLEVDNIWVRGRMHVYELLIHQIRATNGSIFVSNTGKVTAVTGTGPYTLTTDPEHGFAVGDLIRAQRFTGTGTYQCNMQVTGVTNSKVFVGMLSSGDVPTAGMDFVRLGSATDTNRRGGLYLTADDSGAPYMDVFDGVSSFATWGTAGVIKTRLGKLDGLGLPGSYTSEYGLFAGNGTTDASAYIRLSNKTNRLNNLPLEWWSGGTKMISIDSTDGLVMQTSTAYSDRRSVTWKSGTTKIADAAAYSNPGVGRQVGMGVYQSSATDLSILYLAATNTSSKWPYVALQAQRNTAGAAEDVTMYVGRIEAMAFTGVWMGGNAKVTGTLAVTGAATFSSTIAVTSYGTFTGGKAVVSNASPYYGFSLRAENPSAFSLLHGAHTTGGATLGGFWITGGANIVNSYEIGPYTDRIARFWPATNKTELMGPLTVAGALSGTTGTFTGAISGTTGIFSSTVDTPLLRSSGSVWASGDQVRMGQDWPTYGVSIYTATAGGWARGYSFRDSAGTMLGQFGGLGGPGDVLGGLYIGLYADYIAYFTVATKATQFYGLVATTSAFNAGTSYQRNGTAGSILVFVPPFSMVDTGGATWANVTKAAGSYYFDVQLNGNGLPAAAKGVLVYLSGMWSGANNGYYCALYQYGSGTHIGNIRAWAATVASDAQISVPLDSEGRFTATVAGAVNMTAGYLRCVGYYI